MTLGMGFSLPHRLFILFSVCIHVCMFTSVYVEARGQPWVFFFGCRTHLSKTGLPVSSVLDFHVDFLIGSVAHDLVN